MKLTALELLERRMLLSAAVGTQPTGALSGKIIFCSGGHGYTAFNTTDSHWETGRPLTNGMVEDMGNLDQLTQLAHYVFDAGGTVVPMRPIDHQTNEVVIDNGSATYTGSWTNDTTDAPYFSLANGTEAIRFRTSAGSASETATAKYTPNIASAGFYPVYGWAQNDSSALPDQTYRITYFGGVEEVKVNTARVGKGWIYLGTYYFNAGTSGFVEVSNKTSAANPSSLHAVADAIRFGNGIGDINRGAGVSGHSREDEQSLYWIQAQAGFTAANTPVAASTYRGTLSLDQDANVGAPPRWGAYMNDSTIGPMTDRLFLSYHSNAAGGGISNTRGTLGLYNGNNDPTTATPNQQAWAGLMGHEVTDELVALGTAVENPWANNAQVTLDRTDIEFGEINNHSVNSEFDATICEVAYHDNLQDAQDLEDPKVRGWVARASEHAMVKYFNQFGGGALNFMPDSPINVKATVDASGNVTISWAAPVPDGAGAGVPSGYTVYQSTNGYGFDGGTSVGNVLSYTIPAGSLGSGAYYFRVDATNAGGESLPSNVVGARKNPSGAAPILIVNGFDRNDRFEDDKQTASDITGSVGSSVTLLRVRPRYNNTFDYVVQAGNAIAVYSTVLGFSSCQNDEIRNGTINLANYQAVIWLSGEQSSKDITFTSTEQTAATNYLNGGGKLFVSGSEVGYDLVSQNHGPSFFTGTLKSTYVSDDANVYAALGSTGSIFAGVSPNFDNGTSGTYDVDFPDVIGAIGGSSVAMTYSGGSSGAATQFSSGNQRVVMLAFPFETITTAANRNTVMADVLNFFALDTTPPTLTAAAFNYLTGHNATYTFSENVSASLSTSDLTVTNTTTSTTLTSGQMALSYNGGNNTATLTFPGFTNGILPDGNYHTVITGSGVTDPAGNAIASNPVFDFFVLTGDADHNRTVDTVDFNALAANFGLTGKDFAHGNFNYDNTVDTIDFNLLASKFASILAPGALPAARVSLFGDTRISEADQLVSLLD